jgi:glyceraldehyde-3-phosphate dehydrogenase/erythrose-4-phosphate dehydrogenase
MPTKAAINGFGRAARMLFRAALHHPELELIAINDLTDAVTLALWGNNRFQLSENQIPRSDYSPS